MANDSTTLYLPGEYCEVCGDTVELGIWKLEDIEPVTVCHPCYDGTRFEEWLIEAMEEALEESLEYVRTADGKWKFVGN